MNTPLFSPRVFSAGLCLLGFLASSHSVDAQSVAVENAGKPPLKTGAEVEAVAPPVPKGVINGEGYQVVGFDRLASFSYTPPELSPAAPNAPPPPSGANQIPARIKALDATKVMVTGFMLPVKMDQGLVTEFLLVKDPMMCCYGIMPKINDWVVVKMTGKGVPPLMDVPISFEGKLRVGELYDNGYLTGIYLLEGEKQASPMKG